MVNYSDEQLNTVFSALSDQTRRAILARLVQGEARVSELAEPFGMSLPAVSKHIKILEQANLITRTVEGRVHHCRFNPQAFDDAMAWLEYYQDFWSRRLDNLDDLLTTPQSNS